MRGRVLNEVKLPFPDDFFPPVTVSAQLAHDCHSSARQLLNATLDTNEAVLRLHPSQQPNQWKLIGNRNGLELYRERGLTKGEAVKVHVLGQMTGTLDAVLHGLYAPTNGALKTQRAIMHSNYLDAAVLHVLQKDCCTDDESHFAGLKWLACASAGKLVRKRDVCWYEELGRTRDAQGQEVGYLVMQSVRVSECPPLDFQGLTRSNAAVCYIFRPLANQRVAVYMQGVHEVSGKSRSWSADSIRGELWLGVANAVECATAKQLSALVRGNDRRSPHAPYVARSKACEICDSKLKLLKRMHSCKICGRNVCAQCRLAKLIYPTTGNTPCSHYFCKPCLSNAKDTLYRRPAMNGFESPSVHIGSDRSESSPTTYAPLTERLVPSSLPVSVVFDPNQSHRVRLDESSSLRKRGPYSESPQSTISCVSSARTTTSLDLTTSRSPSLVTPEFTLLTDSLNDDRPTSASQSSSSQDYSRSVGVRTASNSSRTPSNPFRRKFALRGYTNYQLPTPFVYMHSQSMDSTHDIQEIESCDSMSDDSEVSEEFAQDDEVQMTRLPSRRRQPIYLYDASEGGVIELSQSFDLESDSVVEPQSEDMFDKDNLKYLNSASTTDTHLNAKMSSNGSSEPENLMARLLHINMAAEATYLMTKYNASIPSQTTR